MTFAAAYDWARRHVSAGRLPTAILGVADADGILALDAFGQAAGRTARADDHYRLFSITKPLVGLSAARAIERGMLTPETPLAMAVPGFGADRDDIVRLRHLASHTSGIIEPPLDAAQWGSAPNPRLADARPQGLRQALLAGGRDFAAGTVSRYSSVAFEGIAAMIEAGTAASWDADVDTWAQEIGADGFTLDEASHPHEIPDAAAAGVDMELFARLRHPGAGLIGRASDLLALGSALLRTDAGERTVVSPATLAMMRRPLTGDIPRLEPYPAERGQDWGFTWNLRSRAPGLIDRDVYGHGGWSGTEFWVHPTAGITWVLLTNQAMRPGVDADELDNAVIAGL